VPTELLEGPGAVAPRTWEKDARDNMTPDEGARSQNARK